MSLTKTDLDAISQIVNTAIDDSKLQTATGFAEVHEKFAEVHQKFATLQLTVDQIERVQLAEIARTDRQGDEINRLRTILRTA